MLSEKKGTLILCVDRDNDIGVKTGIKTPIIGRESNLQAASKLALIDPEESDANAIFGALRAYDNLLKELDNKEAQGEIQIATIAGSEFGGVKADRQLKDQLLKVLTFFSSNSVVLVSDGFSDEQVIPIIQSHIPILSIERIVVKHSARIEESWAVFTRYITRLLEDPYYSRWILGAPGVLLIALSLLWLFGPKYVGIVFLMFLGILFVIKGFNVDKKIVEWVFPNPPNLVRLFTTATALIIVGLDGYQTYVSLYETAGDPSGWLEIFPQIIGLTMKFATNLIVVAFLIFMIGIALYFYFMRDPRIWWTVIGIVTSLWMREVSLASSEILLSTPIPVSLIYDLILITGLGIVTTVIVIKVTMRLSKRFEYYFNRYEAESNEKG